MNYIKKTLVCAAAAGASALVMATPEVSDVTMTQNGIGRLVTITYRLTEDAVVTLDVMTNATPNAATGWSSIGGKAICNAKGAVWRKVTSADADGQGKYTITWRPDRSWTDENGNGFKIADGCAKAVVTAYALDDTPDYMVVDISTAAQPNTQTYYPAVDFLPGGILGKPEYRTTMIVMRKIMAKGVTWTMGSTPLESNRYSSDAREATHLVTLTNNYYIGVFPVTQAQWALIKDANQFPSYYNNLTDRAMRPVEKVCYNEIRNSSGTGEGSSNYWPNNPASISFMGQLRTKTGIDFDLPGEAQWEFAARAGNGDTKWGDGTGIQNAAEDERLNRLGRYQRNGGQVQDGSSYVAPDQSCSANNGTAIVGSYLPNDWGLYDMFGNVFEWCLDWWGADITTYDGKVNVNPSTPGSTLAGVSGTHRVIRGGSHYVVAGECRPAYRYLSSAVSRSQVIGFRLSCTAGLQ